MTSVRKERRVAPVAILVAGTLLASPPMPGSTQTPDQEARETQAATRTPQSAAAATVRTLDSFVDLRKSLLRDMEEINRRLASTASDMEKKDLKLQLDKLDADLRAVTANFENIAAGVDATSLRAAAAEEFNSQRVPIESLVGLKSRPARHDEPWFPCKKGDWVILGDGVRGKVIGVSPELVQLVERGGAQLTYQTGDFLAKSPRNLATNFRLKETLGISYKLQKESTVQIPETLQAYIQKRADQEGYADKLLNLRVEFALANTSSLDVAVIADFDGALGDLCNRLRRAIQRWCVDACTEFGWEIPFPQMTLHGAVARGDRSPAPMISQRSATTPDRNRLRGEDT